TGIKGLHAESQRSTPLAKHPLFPLVAPMKPITHYILKIFRGEPGHQYWEEFELPWSEGANVILSLMRIQAEPVTREGKRVTPIAWEQGCLEEVCGSCSMLIHGRPRQACTALIAPLVAESGSPIITLAPLSKFPLVR